MVGFTLRQIEYAVLTADLGSVAAAAARLGVAQPSVSAALQKLEGQLGLQLFVRQAAKGISPSSHGKTFLTEARSFLAHARDLEMASRAFETDVRGELRLGSFFTLAPIYMPTLVNGFIKAYPKTSVHLEEGAQDALLEGLRTGRLDVALLYNVDLPKDIRSHDVMQLSAHIVLPAEHALARKNKVSLRELRDVPYISLNIEPSRTYFHRILAGAGVIPRIGFETSSIEMVRGMVAGGAGYSLLVTRPFGDRAYDGKKIAVREIADTVEKGIVTLATLKQTRQSRTTRGFEDFCVQHFLQLKRKAK